MKGLARVCKKQKIIIAGGEIAEVPDMVKGFGWGAAAVGIVEKKKFITGASIKAGDDVIGLLSPNFRCNGFSLIRHILKKKYGRNWHTKKWNGRRWGDIVLDSSVVYHDAVLHLTGRFGQKPSVNIKGIAHITGGGLTGNIPRILPKGLGVILDRLPSPPPAMLALQKLGHVSDKEAYRVWNMGVGMVLIADETDKALSLLKKQKMPARVIGKVTRQLGVTVRP
ncbi:MAG: Phosphoribosylformylglycinamidine cyclo-ligase [Candidatus Peregrinibacteria bacterium GW2011_GWA2_47_7]|nr:MAG: Phosphoribosylformylglycinamidine cyclo-ligase [Candidatus Peregrinibacteria bacterium GW2011_GWA2_47_7]